MGPIRKLVSLLVLVLVAYAGFRWGPYVFPAVERALGLGEPVYVEAPPGSVPDRPSPEVADATLDRFEAFRRGEGGGRLALSGNEVSSVIRYAFPGIIPPGVDQPEVALEEGRVRLSARVALEAFPRLPALDQVVGILPDTVRVEMEGALVPLDQRFLALLVDRVEASGIPIPRRMVGDILAGLGRSGPASLPADALSVPIPDGIQAVFVQKDSLVLQAR